MIFNWLMNVHIKLMGIIEAEGKYKKFEKLLFLALAVCDVTTITALFIAYTRTHSEVHKIILLSATVPIIVCFFHRLVGYGKRNLLLSIMKKFRFDVPYFVGNGIKANTKLMFMETFYVVFKALIFIVPIIGSFPYMNFLLHQDRNYNNPDFYLFPYLFHFWNVDSFLEYIALSVIQGIAIVLPVLTYFSFITFSIYILNNINAHIKELNEQLNYLIDSNTIPIATRRNGNSFGWIDAAEKTTRYILLQEKLIVIIRHQQFIQRYVTEFISYINFIISMYVISNTAASFFLILGMSEFKAESFRFLHVLFAFCITISGLYVWCYVGQAINNLNDDLQQSLYHSRWYMLPVKLRKFLIITMILTHREKKLTTFGIYKIDLQLYAQILKILYSLVNLVSLKRH